MNEFLKVVVTLVCILLLMSLWGFYNAIRPFKFISSITPKNFNVDYETISFLTKDKKLLRGWFIKNPNPHAKTIILLHGYPADKGDILPVTIFLHKTYNLLYFDFRYLGESEGQYTTVGKNEILDLLAAIDYLKTRQINEVGIWGFSLGAAVALMTAPQSPQIKAIVATASFARLDWMAIDYYKIPLLKYILAELTRFWGMLFLRYDLRTVSPVDAVQNLQIPILLIHSKQDDVISFDNALLLEKALKNNPKAEVLFVDRGRHGDQIKNYDKIIQYFFAKHL